MVTVVALVLAMGLAVQETGQEHPEIPKDSIQVVVTGCLKGRVLAASSVRQTDVQSGPDIRSRSFRLAGKKDVMKQVKEEDGHLVEVTGILKKADLSEPGVEDCRRPRDDWRRLAHRGSDRHPDPADNVVVMDVLSLQ